jgi:hypothetical protein
MFSLQQIWRTRGQNRFCTDVGRRGELAQRMYTHMSKYKNDKNLKKEITTKKRNNVSNTENPIGWVVCKEERGKLGVGEEGKEKKKVGGELKR